MARAEAAHASVRSDSIKGLAQSIAKPAYRRLLTAEPALRRAVPSLIVAFLVTVGIGAIIQVNDRHRQAILAALEDIDAVADVALDQIERSDRPGEFADRALSELARAIPAKANGSERYVLLSDSAGNLVAAVPSLSGDQAQNIPEILRDGRSPPPRIRTGAAEITLPNGTSVLLTLRALKPPLGQLLVVQPRAAALASWRSDTVLTITLFATTGFVLLILGFAFHWQSLRAREADLIFDTVRSRIDTALNRGRCGLWDWDLARGRIFWSYSMFDILGLEPRDDLLTFGEVSALVHPDDVKLYELAAQLAEATTSAIDRAFRMRHARGEWIWLRARCELVQQAGAVDAHLIGIAVDITEQKHLAETTATANLRLRDAIESISEAFVVWDADNRLVLCNSKFQSLHGLPDQPVVRTQMSDARRNDSARTFEARLEDGRWLHISERRTNDGGFVLVGTDITALKRHEERLLESERRLMATVADLRNSQLTLERQAQQLAFLAEQHAEQKRRAEEYHEYCRDIRESGNYLLDVINDILDMSKIEAGRARLELEEVDLAAIFAETIRVVSTRAEAKRLALNVEVSAAVRLRADRRALKQIVLNLLANAVKFTPEGGCVTVRGRAGTGTATIAIEDNGIDIPKEALNNLGRPFEQVESQLTKRHKGSGLGLAIAKSLVELHGGAIRIRSTQGVGTIVLVRLPIAGREKPSAVLAEGVPAGETEAAGSASALH